MLPNYICVRLEQKLLAYNELEQDLLKQKSKHKVA